MKKKHPISDDTVLPLNQSHAAEDDRGWAVKFPFGYKKALKAATDAIWADSLNKYMTGK